MSQTGRLHYAWIVLGVTFLALLAAAGVRSRPSVLIVPLEREFGWDRSTVSLAVSVNILLYGLLGPFAGALYQRAGIRRTTLAALGLLAAGVALSTRPERKVAPAT
jgi:MFS family permease